MGRKVFISILGTTPYAKSVYEKEDLNFEADETRFIQLATLQLIGAEKWKKENSVAIIGLTSKARTENWEFKGKKDVRYGQLNKNEDYVGLKHELEEKFPNLTIDEAEIKDGKDEGEIMENFSVLYGKLKDDDELYFDMTHGFRYLPMLVLVLGNYAKFVLNGIKIEHISYGNYEMKNSHGNCTFIDLSSLIALQNWTNAVNIFHTTGQIGKLIELGDEILEPKRKEVQWKDTNLNALRKSLDSLKKIVNNILLARGKEIVKGVDFKQLKENINQFSESVLSNTIIKPLAPIIKKIYEEFEPFSTNTDSLNVIKSAQWCFLKKQYQLSITYLEEGINTILCANNNLNFYRKWDRDRVDDALCVKKYGNEKNSKNWVLRDVKPHDLEKAKKTVNDLLLYPIIEEYSQLFNAVKSDRNDWNHAGFSENSKSGVSLKEDLDRRLKSVSNIFHEDIIKQMNDEAIFINVSNHDSSNWDEKQKKTALTFGRIIDLKFPDVDSNMGEEYLKNLVANHVDEIRSLSNNDSTNVTVHVMGEMTFTYTLVTELKYLGYKCVASTTKRISEVMPDGTKISKFEFGRFREY